MQSIIYRCLGLLMVIGLAACGSGVAAPTSSSSTTNPTADTSSVQSGTVSEGLEFLHYTVKLTGAETANVEGALQTILLPGAGRLMTFAGPGMNFQALVQTPRTVQSGDYPLAARGDYTAQVSTSFEPSGTYDSNVSGMLKITSADPVQGTFEYSASNEAGDIITASGSFDELAYSYSAKALGHTEAAIPPGRAWVHVLDDEHILSFDTTDPMGLIPADSVFSISFYLPDTISTGEYGLATTFPKPAAGQVGITINNASETLAIYDSNIKGTLTLTKADNAYSGSFTVTAATGGGQEISVEGTFTDLPVIEAQDLP